MSNTDQHETPTDIQNKRLPEEGTNMTTIQPEVQFTAEITEYDNVGMPATHRCDRCQGQAYVEVEMPSKTVLLFCAHHYRKHADVLKTTALRIMDHSKYVDMLEGKFKGTLPTKK